MDMSSKKEWWLSSPQQATGFSPPIYNARDNYEQYKTGDSFTYYDGSLKADGIFYNEGVTLYCGDIDVKEAYIAQAAETSIFANNFRAEYVGAGLYMKDGDCIPVHLNLGGWLDVGVYGTHTSAYFYDGDIYVNDILYTATFFWIGQCDFTVGKYIFMTEMSYEEGSDDIVSLIFAGGPQFFYDINGAGTNDYLSANLYVLGNSGDDADGSKYDWRLEDWEHGNYAIINGGVNSSTTGSVILFGGSTDEIAIHGGSCYLVGDGEYSVEGQVQITAGNLNIMNDGGLTTYGRIGINTGSEDMAADSAVNVFTKLKITNAFTAVADTVVIDHEYDANAGVYHSVTYSTYLNEMTYDEMTRIYPSSDDAVLEFTNAMLDGMYVNNIEETEYDGKTCINYIYDIYDAAVRTVNSNMEANDNSIFTEMDENALVWTRSTAHPTNWFCENQEPNSANSARELFAEGDTEFALPDYHPYFAGTGGAVEKAPDDKGAGDVADTAETEVDGADKPDDGGANGGNGEGDPMDRAIGGDKADGADKPDDGGANGGNGEGDPMDRPIGGDKA